MQEKPKQVLWALKDWIKDTPFRVVGWVMFLIAFITGSIVLVTWLSKNLPPWYVWLGFTLVIIGIIGLSFIPYYKRIKAQKTDSISEIVKELDTTTVSLNGEDISLSRIFWGLSDHLTGTWAGGGLSIEAFPQLLSQRFQESDPLIWTNTQLTFIKTLCINKLITSKEITANRFGGTTTHYVATDLGKEVLKQLRAKGWPEPTF